MSRSDGVPPLALALAFAGVAAITCAPAWARDLAGETTLPAASLVQAPLLAGPGWTVDPEARVRGGLARFTLHTDWGSVPVDGVEQLAVRVAEVPALAALDQATVRGVVADAARERALVPVAAVGGIVAEPTRAGMGLPAGVARYFSDKWQRLRASVRRVADMGNEHWMHSGSPYTNPGGALGAAGDDAPERRRGFWRRLGREAERLAEQEVGYASARRALAVRLGVDPGTRNPLLGPKLDGLAWAETSGRYASGYVLGLLGGPATMAMGRAVQVDQWVLKARPAQVRRVNAGILELHCTDGLLSRAFLRDRAYGALLQSEFIRLLDAVDPSDGCELLLETALMAGDEPQARFVVNGMRLLDASLPMDARRGRFVTQGAWVAYLDPQGRLWLPLGVDWLDWDEHMARWLDQDVFAHAGERRLLVGGHVTDAARIELLARGWRLVQVRDYPGRPPYADDAGP